MQGRVLLVGGVRDVGETAGKGRVMWRRGDGKVD